MAEVSRPKRHHYIPQMILRNFTNVDGGLFFWRRNFAPGEVKSTWTDNLFVESDLYTLIDGAGANCGHPVMEPVCQTRCSRL